MQKGIEKREVTQIYPVHSPNRQGEQYLQLREALLSCEQKQQTRDLRPKGFNKCRSSESYRSVEKVIEKMIPILEKNAAKIRINNLNNVQPAPIPKKRASSIFLKSEQSVLEASTTLNKPNKIQQYKSLKKMKVNIMNLQLVPGQQLVSAEKEQLADNRVKQMVEKRRVQSSQQKLKQRQRFKLACATLLHGKHLKLNSQQFQHNNRFVKHILETLKCSRIDTEQDEINKAPNEDKKQRYTSKERQFLTRTSQQIKRPSSQYLSTKNQRKTSFSTVRKTSVVNMKKMVFSIGDLSSDKIYKKKIESYLDFIYKVNFGNGIYVNLNMKEEADDGVHKIKVFVGKGNNNKLIKSLIRRRFWMELVTQDTKGINFYWTQSKLKNIHAQQQEYKHLDTDYKSKLDKYKVFKNSKNEDNQKILSPNQSKIVDNYIGIYSFSRSIYPKFTATMVTNHIPQNSLIGNKKALFHSLHYYYKNILNVDPFEQIPLTFHIKSPTDQSYQQFLKYNKKQSRQKVWIVKPGQNTNRGNGINLAYTNQIMSLVSKKKVGNSGIPRTYIVQSYINNPFLYYNRKFDIRHYMMITSINGILKGYWYQDGYIRTSSEIFDLEDIDNKYIHLTNDAIQKYGDDYGKYQLGNKVSYTEFQRYLDNTYPAKKYSFETMVLPKMKDLALDAIRANFINLDSKKKLNNFQIYGMDFMIDANFKPWLIQINANPCLQMSCPILTRIIPPLIQNTLRLGLDPLFPPPHHYPSSKRFQLSDNFLSNLRYKIIFDERKEKQRMIDLISQTHTRHQIVDDISDFEDQYEDQGQQVQHIQY